MSSFRPIRWPGQRRRAAPRSRPPGGTVSLSARERRVGVLADGHRRSGEWHPPRALLRQESRRRAVGDGTCEIGRRVGGDQDHDRSAVPVVCGQTPGQLKPALTSERDVYQDDLRPELLCSPHRLSRGSGDADNAQASSFQPIAGGLQEQRVVVHDEDTERRRHVNSVPASAVRRIRASRNRKRRAPIADPRPMIVPG